MNPIEHLGYDPTAVGWVGIIVGVLAFILVVLWVLMPIAVFGIKDRLNSMLVAQNKMLEETDIQNKLLAEQNQVLAELLADVKRQTGPE